jgi:ABC-type amino acid transport substrate-binding protein
MRRQTNDPYNKMTFNIVFRIIDALGVTGMLKIIKIDFLAALVFLTAVLPGSALAAEPVSIAITDNYPPFTVIDPIGEPRGLLIDMWREWSKATGTPIEFQATSWADTLKAVRSGEADIHSGLFKNAERSEYLDFSEPIHEIKTGVFFKAGGELVPLDRLAGEKVGTIEDTYQHRYIQENLSGLNVVGYPSGEDLALALLKGEIRAAVSEVPAMRATLARLGLQGAVERHRDIVFSNQLFTAVKKGRSDLLEKINEGFRAILPTALAKIERLWLPDINDHFYSGAGERLTFTEAEEA